MNEQVIFIVLFCGAFFFHELSHIAYAKFVGVYKRTTIFRLYNISKKIPQKGIWRFPIGIAIETNLEKETLHQRVFNCLCGTLGGLPFLVIGLLILPDVEVFVLFLSYLVGFSVDLVTVLQVTLIARSKGWKLKLMDVV